MKPILRNDYLQLHFIVFLFGLTGVLGKLISLSALPLVQYRVIFAALGMGALAWWRSVDMRVSARQLFQLLGVGSIVAAHWFTFYYAIKISNVSVTLGCFASATLFTAILEPILERKKVSKLEIYIGILVIIGLYFITRFAIEYWQGIVVSVVSAFLSALFGVLNKQLVRSLPPVTISLYAMLASVLLLSIAVAATQQVVLPWEVAWSDYFWLLILSGLCTVYAFIGIVSLMQRLSAYTIVLAINMEPIYAIVLATMLFKDSEQMDWGLHAGAFILIATIFMYPMLQQKANHLSK